MSPKPAIFEGEQIRKFFDRDGEQWYFSVVDVVAILTDSTDPRQYVKKLRSRDPELKTNWGTICTPLEMPTKDGKKRMIVCANTENLLRIIQSISSPKAEPFKLWLAKVGNERLEETADPEKTIDRALIAYSQKGYSKEWINQRHQIEASRLIILDFKSGAFIRKVLGLQIKSVI